MTFTSIKTPQLSDEIVQQIKNAIAENKFQCGDKLPSERELSDQFNVSRVTVRDALNTLHTLGLINVKKGKNGGAYITKPTADPIIENFKNLVRYGIIDYWHLFDARLYIEPMASQVVAQQKNRSHELNYIKEILNNAESNLSISWKRARQLNVSFHNEIAKLTKNEIIIYMTESITQAFSLAIIEKTENYLNQNIVYKFINEHRSILNSIENNQPEKAYDLTKKHLIETRNIYSKFLSNSKNENQK